MKDKEKQIGKFKDINELLKAYQSLEKEFTKRCQRLKELEEKLPKYSVVLSREAYEILTKDIEHPTDEVLKKLVVGKNILTEQVIEKTRKETAEMIFQDILKEAKDAEFGGWIELEASYVYKKIIDKAKQFGVEIKE